MKTADRLKKHIFVDENAIVIDFTIYSAIFVSLYLVYILLNYKSIFIKWWH